MEDLHLHVRGEALDVVLGRDVELNARCQELTLIGVQVLDCDVAEVPLDVDVFSVVYHCARNGLAVVVHLHRVGTAQAGCTALLDIDWRLGLTCRAETCPV